MPKIFTTWPFLEKFANPYFRGYKKMSSILTGYKEPAFKHLTKFYAPATVQVLRTRASLVVQWLRICLPMQKTWVWALVQEDPTCRRATKPVRHNYWACALQPASHNYWRPCTYSPCSATREATAISLHTTKSSPCLLQLEKSPRAAMKTQCSQK